MSGAHDKAIAAAALDALGPLGMRRKGRSRVWIDDHGWWLINVEFQPSSFERGCYLNVGEQHLWVVTSSIVFERPERPLGGSTFVAYNGDVNAFAKEMAHVAQVAAHSVIRRREAHKDGKHALVRLASGRDDLNAGIAAALLGDVQLCETRLKGHVHQAYRAQADRYVGVQPDEARRVAIEAVQSMRAMLGLRGVVEPQW